MILNARNNCVLLVDDDPDDIFLHRLVIEESLIASRIVVAENGEAAWKYISRPEQTDFEKPSVIFLDINMPRMNGFEFLALYKTLSEEQRQGTKLVVLSSSSHDHQKTFSIYPDIHYVTKPLTSTVLSVIVNDESSFLNA